MKTLSSPRRTSIKAHLLLASWGFLLAVFFFLGLKGLIRRPERFMPPTAGRWATANYLFLTATRAKLPVAQTSETILRIFDKLPPGESVLFVAPGPAQGIRFQQGRYLFGYVAWPRKVWSLACGESGKPHEWLPGPAESTKIDAVVLFLIPVPSWAHASETVALDLVVIPLSEAMDWTSFCPL